MHVHAQACLSECMSFSSFKANEIEFKDITREEAVLILLSLPEEVSLLVQFKKSGTCTVLLSLVE